MTTWSPGQSAEAGAPRSRATTTRDPAQFPVSKRSLKRQKKDILKVVGGSSAGVEVLQPSQDASGRSTGKKKELTVPSVVTPKGDWKEVGQCLEVGGEGKLGLWEGKEWLKRSARPQAGC